jgi:uncharacterized protein YkwD
MRARHAVLVAIALSIIVVGTACVPKPSAGPSGGGGGGVAGDLINRHNGARANAGLPGFMVDGAMNANAQFHANRLAAGSNGCNLWHSGELGGWYSGHAAGENVACLGPCPGDGGQLMSMWLNSPGHRANIMNGAFRYIGVGVACNGHAMYAVTHFRS